MKYIQNINIILLGSCNTGKTSFFNRISKHKFYYNYTKTIGIDYYSDRKIIHNKFIKINLWDSGHICDKILNNYIINSDIVILFINTSNEKTQIHLLNLLKNKNLDNKKIYIFGNIIKNKKIKFIPKLLETIYISGIKFITIDILNNYNYIYNFYNDIIKQWINKI